MKNLFILPTLLILLSSCGSSSKSSDLTNIDREGIKKTVLSQRKSIRECYGTELAKKGSQNLAGKITLNFDINGEGKAQKVSVLDDKSTLKNKSLSDCISSQLQTWTFPTAPDGQVVNVSYPFSFKDTPARNMQDKMDQYKKINGAKTPQ